MSTSDDDGIVLAHRRKSPAPGIRKTLYGLGPLLAAVGSFVLLLVNDDRQAWNAALAVFLAAMAVLMYRGAWWLIDGITDLIVWWGMHRGPDAAMRLTERGVDYSPAWRGTGFDIFVPWSEVTGTAFRPGLGPAPIFCVDTDGRFPPGPRRAPSPALTRNLTGALEWVRLVRRDEPAAAGMDDATLANIFHFGTPLVINLRLCNGVDTGTLDRRLREWTGGRCTCEPPPDLWPGSELTPRT
ncbi:hypothetical protein [Actinoplanes sp. NPDC049316]|uniref:hypothetical protein n=1 Tax=Actinoplanes sp. NPDC049316 TaxID=3154727 RepID=UPI003421B882